jgi:NADH-quinone oxidoreductase subunit C
VTVTPEEIIAAVGGGLPPEVRCEADHRGVMLRVPPGHWLAALAFAREGLDCDFFDWLTAVDEADEGFSVVVHVYSLAGRHHVLVATPLPRSSPRLPTATGIYRGAAWHERETHEMFGIGFDGHPHLAPLLLPDGFEGHPLRKDFVLAARAAKEWPGMKEPGERPVPQAERTAPGAERPVPRARRRGPPHVPDGWGPV